MSEPVFSVYPNSICDIRCVSAWGESKLALVKSQSIVWYLPYSEITSIFKMSKIAHKLPRKVILLPQVSQVFYKCGYNIDVEV